MKDTLPPLPDSPSRSNSTSNISTPPSPNSPTSALVRRHHTLSTSAGSKLNFSERREARTALLSTGLSEADINYYVPSSPIDSVIAWSDNGHSGNSTTASSSSSSSNIPLSKSSNSHRHIRGVSIGGSSTSSNSVFDESAETSPSQLSTSSPTFHSSTLPSSPPPASSSRRSSFVVLRGARGDAALTERRTVSDSRRLSSASSTGGHRNSLTSFLETDAEGLGQEDEEWEKGLKDERDREQEERITSSTFSSPPSSSNSTFRLPARASTLSHTRSISSVTQSDAWHSKEVPSVLRRPQSLNFRPSPSSRANKSEAWRSHDRGVSEGYAMASTLPPPPPMSNSSGYSSRSPIPLSEPSTPHNNNKSGLNHSNSYSSQHSNSGRHNNNNAGGGTGLTHSSSFGSHHSHHSISNGVAGIVAGTSTGGPLSPVGGFGRSPWSPTREETQGMVSRAGITGSPPKNGGSSMLNRHGSNSSGDSGRQYLDAEEDVGDDEEIDVVDLVNIPMGEASNSRNSRSILTTSTNSDILRSKSPSSPSPSRRLPPLVTNPEGLAAKKSSFRNRPGPASASPFVPPIGHSHLQALSSPSTHQPQHPSTHPSFHQSYTSSTNRSYNYKNDRKNQTAAPGTGSLEWSRQKELLVGVNNNGSTSNGGFTSASNDWPPSGGFGVGLAIQQQQQIQVLQNQMMQAMEAMEALKLAGVGGANFGNLNMGAMMGNQIGYNNDRHPNHLQQQQQEDQEVEEPPIDVPTLIREKGYNPILFDLKPPNARFFVIKSYTEEDVHKSLKHEIWASTDLGNKRLDKAFRENDSKGPIYLFFSVNGSGHFAGVARMISTVDYTTSSTVWASDKWKGIFQVQWIYIKDVPLASLRHIRLANTPENKPVTSSRDTQEVPYEAGCEVLRILSTYLARTSLLQDFAWYEAKKDEPPASATTTDSATTSNTATPSILSKPLPQINSHYNSHRPSIPFPAPQGNYLQQPFQLYPQPQSQQYYTNNINNTSNLNYQQQQHQAHFVPPPFQTQLLQQPQPMQIMNPFQYNPLLMQQQQLFQQQQQYYNARKYSNSNKGASGGAN